uniref:Tubulin--tyrosine ligase-like protein 9 n=1 Tax=Nomascus leucogenys TaxID=61853 RepID=A0A2I3H793_NOMLE
MSRPKMTSLYPEKTQRIYKLPKLIIQQGHQIQEPKLQGPWIVKGKRARAESIHPVQDHPHEHTHGRPSPQARMGGSEGDTRSSDNQKDDIPVENYVAQRYIENPYLIGGRKFDLRVYVLVMSYIPLRAWLYRDGFARFSNTRFTLNSIDDQYVHLTNVAVQKTSPDYHPKKGCKWMLQRFRQYLASKHGPEAVETLFRDIDNIFVKSLQSVQKVIISDKHCFELYGYDILIDQDLKPWLLEVNASPSLTASSQEDYELKTCLLEDTLHVVDMEARLTGREKRVGGFDLMWNDGPVSREEGAPDLSGMGNFVTNTHLGCVNDRKKQLRQLFCSLQLQKKASS